MKIIDAHSHIGDILYPGGGELIFKTGIPFPPPSIYHRSYEKTLFRETFVTRVIDKAAPMIPVNCERRRNFAATMENFRASLAGTEISRCVCAPIAPNVTFADILAAQKADPRIVAFTTPDFTASGTVELLTKDLPLAAGVKIHPIIQETEADSREVIEAVEVVAAFPKPVLLHAGESLYYTRREKKARFTRFASIDKIGRLIAAFPGVKFIVGHAGLGEVAQTIGLLPKYKNAYVDASFQTPEAIGALISAFGGGRVLFASDWPYGMRPLAILAMEEACKGDEGLRRAVFHDNAAELLGLCTRS